MKGNNKTGRPLKRAIVVASVFLSFSFALILIWRQSQPVRGQVRPTLWVRSTSFADGGSIPRLYTCDGDDVSPQLAWQAVPAGTKSIALVMDDPDAPVLFTHWMVYNLAPRVRELTQGASTHGAMPAGSAEGQNSFGHSGYGGPCPPPGNPHHYVFRVYALDRLLDLEPGASRRQLDTAMDRHVLAFGQLVGIYRRSG